jgi:hypothetical protein
MKRKKMNKKRELEESLNKNGVHVTWNRDYKGKCNNLELAIKNGSYETTVLMLKQMVLPFGIIIKNCSIGNNHIEIDWYYNFSKRNMSKWNEKELFKFRTK